MVCVGSVVFSQIEDVELSVVNFCVHLTIGDQSTAIEYYNFVPKYFSKDAYQTDLIHLVYGLYVVSVDQGKYGFRW